MANRATGTVFKIGANAVGGIKSIGGVNWTAAMIDCTELTDENKQQIPGLKSVGDIPVSGFLRNNDTNGQSALMTAFTNGTLTAFTIEFPSALAASWTFNAYVSGFSTGETNIDGTVDFEATLSISGAPSLNLTTSTGLTTPFFVISNSAVITPAPSGSVYDYVATVLTGVTSVTVTPTAAAGVITVNGNVVSSGVASSAIALGAAGTVTTITIVVTESGKTPKTYTIKLARAAS